MNIKMINTLHYTVSIATFVVDVTYDNSMTWLVSCRPLGLLAEFESLDLAFDYCRGRWFEWSGGLAP